MGNSRVRLNRDFVFIKDSAFIAICRCFSQNHFTRNRKLSLNHLILSIFNRKGSTLSMEIRRFFRLLKSKNTEVISNVGYLKQRLKLNPAAFMALSDFHVKNFYDDEKELIKFKNHFVFAVDGSHVNVPNTQENEDLYGLRKNQSSQQQAQAVISCLYDVFNKMILDCTINDYKVSERVQAEVHIEKITSFIGDQPYIVVLDRGYPSSFFFMNRLEKNQNFIVRLGSSDFRQEQRNMASADEDVEIVFTKSRVNPYRKTPFAKRLQEKGSIRLRFVKVNLPGETTEFLATNLSREDFSQQEISELYRIRWSIETAYDTLKNKFMLENFTGKKSIIIEQDILATICLYNMTQDMLRDAEMVQKEKNKQKHYKYKMTVNVNLAIGIIKDELIRMALENSLEKRAKIFAGIIEAIAGNIVPVRENRQFKRGKKHPAIKYPVTKKRSY